ncbi:MAG: hypothetical protein RML46_12685 [Anaerolineae bacterium]|nr:hypothetical protein [Anaerolineae bacterium]MDW8069749.1 hypothetical protein [Anaerolineae bacterium]
MIGLLWFDDDPRRDLEEKVGNAARRYMEKFGRPPTVCYVHPSMVGHLISPDNGHLVLKVEGRDVCVVPRRSVLRDHFWLGEGPVAEH